MKITLNAIVHIIGTIIAFSGAAVIWSIGGSIDDLDYHAAISGFIALLFFIVSALVPALVDFRLFALGNCVVAVFNFSSFAEVGDLDSGERARKAAWGSALLVVGMWIAMIGVFPLQNAKALVPGLKRALGSHDGILAIVSMTVSVLGAILCWAWAGEFIHAVKGDFGILLGVEAGFGTTTGVGQLVFMNVFIFGAAYFGKNAHATAITLFLGGYLLIETLTIALNHGDFGFKKDLARAAGVITWIGQILQCFSLTVFPMIFGGKGKVNPSRQQEEHPEKKRANPA